MLDFFSQPFRSCDGISRRSLLRAGVLGLTGLSLPDLFRAKANGQTADPNNMSVILVWLDGGPPQHETYDPKPEAPIEFRGPLNAINTTIPGIQVSECLPEHARLMDKMAFIRSMHHDNGDHFAAAHWMLTGYLGSNASSLGAQYPSIGSVIAKTKGPTRAGMPAYVGVPNTHSVGLAPGYHGAAYLGVAYNPFSADGDPNSDGYHVPNLNLPGGVNSTRLGERRTLLSTFDTARRDVDSSGLMDGLDRFGQQAFELVSGTEARQAFNLKQESPRLRDRYGRNQWGQSALLARRLVSAGVRFVTLTFGGWDMHSSIDKSVRRAVPMVDSSVATLIDDLDVRGMLDSTMVIVMGEFGRTPRINKGGVPGSDPVPGRDHWGEVMSVLVAGGGVRGGQVIGASNSRGEVPKEKPLRPQDLAVTIYRKLGIDPDTSFVNRSGRPIPIGSNGRVIEEMM